MPNLDALLPLGIVRFSSPAPPRPLSTMRSLRTFARSARQVHRGAVRFASTEEKAAAGQSRRGGGFAGVRCRAPHSWCLCLLARPHLTPPARPRVAIHPQPFFLGAVAGSGALYVAVTQGLLPVGPAPAPTSTTTSRQPTPPTPVDYARVRSEIAALISEDDNRGPLFVRLAWHCAGARLHAARTCTQAQLTADRAAGTFDKSTGKYGSNGATMRFHPEADHGANAGLHLAREMLEPIKTRNPGAHSLLASAALLPPHSPPPRSLPPHSLPHHRMRHWPHRHHVRRPVHAVWRGGRGGAGRPRHPLEAWPR